MNSHKAKTANKANTSMSSTPQDYDLKSFTDQELQTINATEAAFHSGSSSSKKRDSTSENRQQKPYKTHPKLPNSIPRFSKSSSLSPCQDNVRMRHPEMKFDGRILYSKTAIRVEEAARELLRSLKAKKGEAGKVTVGLDIEWKPTFRKGALPGKVAVMQICGDARLCHVMHVIHSGITQSLQSLLEDSTVLKVGAGIGNDCVKVFRDYNVSVKEVEDLSYLANQKLGEEPKTWGLRSLTELLVGKELRKPKKITLSNWEADVLSEEQRRYAATDAFASWHLHQVLKSLPDSNVAAVKQSKEPKVLAR